MIIGLPKEIKEQEARVGLTPHSVKELVNHGHKVLVEKNAGINAGFENEHYRKIGAKIIDNPSDIFNDAEMIIKVKEPLEDEVKMLRENQILFSVTRFFRVLVLKVTNKSSF